MRARAWVFCCFFFPVLSDSLSIPESPVNKNVFPSLISEAAEPPSLGSGCKGARDCIVAGESAHLQFVAHLKRDQSQYATE